MDEQSNQPYADEPTRKAVEMIALEWPHKQYDEFLAGLVGALLAMPSDTINMHHVTAASASVGRFAHGV